MANIDEIRKLDPEERIEKLKELGESRKREIEEAEALIRDSMRELSEAAERKHAPIRQVTADDISQLLTVEERRVFKTARFQESTLIAEGTQPEPSVLDLEETAHEEAQKQQSQQSGRPLYGQAIEDAKKRIDYSAKITTTGMDTGKAPHEIYSSRSAAGQESDIQNIYSRQQVDDRTSGMYGRTKEEEEAKIRREREPW